jgi:hypothetical protein
MVGADFIRGPVLTDEGGLREDFPGAALSGSWTPFTTGVPTITVAGSSVSFNVPAPSAIGNRAIISRPIDFMPLIANIFLNVAAARVAGYDFFWGLYNTSDPDLATAFVEQRFLGTGAVGTANILTQSAAGSAETLVALAVGSTATAVGMWRTIALDGEALTVRDTSTATNALPTTTVRTNQSRHLPGLYESLFFAMGIRISAATAAVAAGNTYGVDTAFVKNLDRMVVNTSF